MSFYKHHTDQPSGATTCCHDQLTDDFYAPSCQDSRQSLWKTWCTIAKAWDLLPLPITDELVLAIGASLKHGGYRSSKNYFSRAQQKHEVILQNHCQKGHFALIAKVTRSINRGIGPNSKIHLNFMTFFILRYQRTRRAQVTGTCTDTGHRNRVLLVAPPRHRSCGSQDETCMETCDIHCQHHILHFTHPEERHQWNVCQPWSQLCVREESFQSHLPTLCDDTT